MKDDTVLIVMPEIGRNLNANSIIDQNGRAALDHTNGDPMARDVFCMVIGPDGVVNQDSLNTDLGATVDVVPTIADILDSVKILMLAFRATYYKVHFRES